MVYQKWLRRLLLGGVLGLGLSGCYYYAGTADIYATPYYYPGYYYSPYYYGYSYPRYYGRYRYYYYGGHGYYGGRGPGYYHGGDRYGRH